MAATKKPRRTRSRLTALGGDDRQTLYDRAVSKVKQDRAANQKAGSGSTGAQQTYRPESGSSSASTGTMRKPDPASRPRRFQTTRGRRRLSFAEAYSRRTTPSSKARVMELYGRTRPPGQRTGPQNIGRGNLLNPTTNSVQKMAQQVAQQRTAARAGGNVPKPGQDAGVLRQLKRKRKT